MICAIRKDSKHKEYGIEICNPITELLWHEVQLDFIIDLLVNCKIKTENGFSKETRRTGYILVCCDKLNLIIHSTRFKYVPNVIKTAIIFIKDVF